MAEMRDETRMNRLAYFIDLARRGKKVGVDVALRRQRVEKKVHPDETNDMTGVTHMYLLLADFLCECEGQVSTISKIYVYGSEEESLAARRVNASVANERLKMDYQRLKDARIRFAEKFF